MARIVAMVLQMAGQQGIGETPALFGGAAARHRAAIDGEEIAAGRQHIAAPAPWRAGGSWRDMLAVECGEQRGPFACGASLKGYVGWPAAEIGRASCRERV